MKKYVYFFMAGLTSLVTNQLPAYDNQHPVDYYNNNQYSAGFAAENCSDTAPEIFAEVHTGYSRSDAYLSFESPLELEVAPGITLVRKNAASEWRNLDTYTIGGKARILGKKYYGRVHGSYGEICDGRNASDYSQTFLGSPTRISLMTTSLDSKKKSDGYTYDISVGAGYPLFFVGDSLVIAPVIGYSYYEMKLHDKISSADVTQQINIPPSLVLSTVTRGSNKSKFRWSSGWIGADLAYSIDCAWKLLGNFELHYGRVSGYSNGDINTIQTSSPVIPVANTVTQKSKFHAKRAWGTNLSLSLLHKFYNGFLADWTVGVTGSYFHVSSDAGSNRENSLRIQTAPLPGPAPLAVKSTAKLSKVEINTYGVTLNLGRSF